MPYETEAKINLRVRYGKEGVAIGDVVLPEDSLSRPTIAFERIEASQFVSLVMWDMDAQNVCLWLVYQLCTHLYIYIYIYVEMMCLVRDLRRQSRTGLYIPVGEPAITGSSPL